MNNIDLLKKKILYRAEYRGIKEMDILLGKFVKKYIHTFTYSDLLDLYTILEKDDDTIFKWYSGITNNGTITESNVSNLLKKFKHIGGEWISHVK